ncbi:hypothetical protein BDR22DRAFT_836467 [Usnea florida]
MASLPHLSNLVDSTEKSIGIAIIGGGIGGLCLALGLLKQSHLDVQVYEAAHTFSEIGAGIAVGLNAARALDLIGPAAKEALEKQSIGNTVSSHNNTFEYRVGTGEKEGTLITAQKNFNLGRTVHRAHFLDELVRGIPPQRAHFNKRLQGLEENENGVILKFKDGTTATADVVIGADGVHSTVREYLVGVEAAKPVFSGAVIYRGLVPMETAIEALGSEHAQSAVGLCGPGKLALSYPIDSGKTLNIAAFEFGHKEWPHDKWIVPAEKGKLAAEFKSWGKPAQDLIKLLDTPSLSAWGIFDSNPAPFFHKGRVAMMGDAAHASTPFQAQGAGQAIEDACVLSALFEKVSSPADVPKALVAYDQVRRPRAQKIVTTSREAGLLTSMSLPGVGEDLDKMKEKLDTRQQWIFDRDLVAQNEEAVQVFQESV